MPSTASRPSLRASIAALLLGSVSLLLWSAAPALAANKNVDIVTGGSLVPPSCDAASYAYSPVSVSVQPGDTVTFRNPGAKSNAHPCEPAAHPTRCAPETNFGKTKGDCPFSNFALDTGASHVQNFPTEGTFQLACLAHPYMLMTVTVGDGEPDPDPTEPDPDPTEPDPQPTEPDPDPTQPEPNGSEPDTPTATATAPASVAPTDPSPSPSASESVSAPGANPGPSLPTEASTDPAAQSDVDVDGDATARGPLLILGTALLGLNIALFVTARNPGTGPSWLG